MDKDLALLIKLAERLYRSNGQTGPELDLVRSRYDSLSSSTGYSVKFTDKGYTVSRVKTKALPGTETCPVCGKNYVSGKGVSLKHNYGGMPRTITLCSSKCSKTLRHVLGDRVSARPAWLHPTRQTRR